MKTIDISELKLGDIFAKELKLRGRECFEVMEEYREGSPLRVKKRGAIHTTTVNTGKGQKVYFLRNKNQSVPKLDINF